MSNPISRTARQLSSLVTETWRSVLSWMRWRLNRRKREEQYLEVLDRLMVAQVQTRKELQHLRLEQEEAKHQIEDNQFRVLMSALRPMADAMLRQDQISREYHQDQVHLLLEVLNSLQPTAQEQIFQQIGQPPPTRSSPSLAS